jgi:uncharacterized protein YndB with AHSA1/START domain
MGRSVTATKKSYSRGPNGYTLLSWLVDLSPGGATRLRLRSPGGAGEWEEGVCLEIVEPERVVFAGDVCLDGQRVDGTAGTVTFRRTEG